jgi:D-alanyl-D-alanine carboxypeptidase
MGHDVLADAVAMTVLATTVVAAVLADSAVANTEHDQRRERQARLDGLVAVGVPGCAALFQSRTTELTSGYGEVAHGHADAHRRPLQDRSLTKTYTASVVLQLVGQHRLGLDDSVERWLSGTTRT